MGTFCATLRRRRSRWCTAARRRAAPRGRLAPTSPLLTRVIARSSVAVRGLASPSRTTSPRTPGQRPWVAALRQGERHSVRRTSLLKRGRTDSSCALHATNTVPGMASEAAVGADGVLVGSTELESPNEGILAGDRNCGSGDGYEGPSGSACAEALRGIANGAAAVDVECGDIGDGGATKIAQALGGNTTVTHLWLHIQMIGDEGAVNVGHALACNSTVQVCYLNTNEIGPRGASALAQGLRNKDSGLKDLNLNENHIGDAGASEIARALATNHTLEILGLHDNDIGDAGVSSLAAALGSNPSVKELHLSCNDGITDVGAINLAEAMAHNTNLQTLNLQCCRGITSAGARAFADALHSNSTLRELELEHTGVGEDNVRSEIRKLLQRNKQQGEGATGPLGPRQ
eukprot:COSAG02_NODE_1608_length_11711_cov_5.975026_7_plen_403_part_00